MRFVAYYPDVLALFYFSLRRLLPDKRTAQAIASDAFKRLKASDAPAGSSEGLMRWTAQRLEFEAVRRDAQASTLTSFAGIVAKAEAPHFLTWAVTMFAIWGLLVMATGLLNVPVDGTQQMRSRRVVLIVMTLVFLGFSASVKYFALHS